MADLRGRIFLVVEDEFAIADELAQALQRSGADVLGPISTLNGTLRVLDIIKRIDGAVLDTSLHGEPVYAVAGALEARGVPFVFSMDQDESGIPARYEAVPRWIRTSRLEDLTRMLEGQFRR